MKKYEILVESETTEIVTGKTLYRIKAIKDFSDVKAGDIGGYIESESNLSQEGDCWIYDDAVVCGYGHVFDNAQVRDNAFIQGLSYICKSAIVKGNADLCTVSVTDFALIYGNARVWEADVSNHAKVGGYSQVCHNAHIGGRAKVYGHSIVCGVKIAGKSCVYGHTRICSK